jgi:hypothetical protein
VDPVLVAPGIGPGTPVSAAWNSNDETTEAVELLASQFLIEELGSRLKDAATALRYSFQYVIFPPPTPYSLCN